MMTCLSSAQSSHAQGYINQCFFKKIMRLLLIQPSNFLYWFLNGKYEITSRFRFYQNATFSDFPRTSTSTSYRLQYVYFMAKKRMFGPKSYKESGNSPRTDRWAFTLPRVPTTFFATHWYLASSSSSTFSITKDPSTSIDILKDKLWKHTL